MDRAATLGLVIGAAVLWRERGRPGVEATAGDDAAAVDEPPGRCRGGKPRPARPLPASPGHGARSERPIVVDRRRDHRGAHIDGETDPFERRHDPPGSVSGRSNTTDSVLDTANTGLGSMTPRSRHSTPRPRASVRDYTAARLKCTWPPRVPGGPDVADEDSVSTTCATASTAHDGVQSTAARTSPSATTDRGASNAAVQPATGGANESLTLECNCSARRLTLNIRVSGATVPVNTRISKGFSRDHGSAVTPTTGADDHWQHLRDARRRSVAAPRPPAAARR